MKTVEVQKKLDSMVGRSFEYAKQVHTVKSAEIDEDVFTIKTDKNTFKRNLENAPEFFKYWYESKSNLELDKVNDTNNKDVEVNDPLFVDHEHSLANELITILKDNIAKVKVSPNYIKQAQAINNNVNSILHVQKLKLDMIKHARRHN